MIFKSKAALFLLFLLPFLLISQKKSFNTTLLSNITFGEESSDVWGFEKDGIKYAIIGNNTKTSVYSLENPVQPVLRHVAPGAKSIWRDIKSYNNHLYVTADQGTDGLVIIDMTGAPGSISHEYFRPQLTVGIDTRELQRCHNLYIDEKGYMYLAGCNLSQRGVMIFDLKENPKLPVYLGAADLTYSHDAFARGDTLYASEINIGKLGIYDVTDRKNPKLLATQTTSRSFTHNAWPSDDGKYVFTTDEKTGAWVDAYDITDLNNIRLLDRFRPLERENDGVIPHNTHYYNGYLITSWYTDGLRIVDAHRPDNLIEVAYYDTWEDVTRCHTGFFGCWGAFPFTGSNLVYGSDINNGLFIVDVDYKRACYLEGKVRGTNGTSLGNVFVEILTDQVNRENSAPSGIYKTGLATAGTYTVRFSHPEYQSKELQVVLENGKVTNLDVELQKKPAVTARFAITDSEQKPVKASVVLNGENPEYTFESNSAGVAEVAIAGSSYNVNIASWGYYPQTISAYNFTAGADPLEVKMESGYADNFEVNDGWTINSTANMSGGWTRAIPRETNYLNNEIANPGSDSDDTGRFAMVTGNGIRGAPCDDVDNGVTELISPDMQIKSKYTKPYFNYDVWFYNAGGNTPINDTLVVKLSNGQKEVTIDKIFGKNQSWLKIRNIDIASFIEITDNMRLIVQASDQSGNQGHIVEAGFDNFHVTEVSDVDQIEAVQTEIQIYPNPSGNVVEVRLANEALQESVQYQILDNVGRVIRTSSTLFHVFQADISDLNAGMYFLNVPGYRKVKFVKL